MSYVDPLDLLARLDSPIEPRADFAESLLASCLSELSPRTRRGALNRHSRLRVTVAVALLVLVLAAVATATYVALRDAATRPTLRPGKVSVIKQGHARVTQPDTSLAKIAVVDPRGRLRIVWACPRHIWCGTLTSVAWSPDGRRLALTLTEVGARSGYVGLHVIDLATGVDRHLGSLPIAHLEREQPASVLRRLFAAETRTLGCPLPYDVAWSPDSTRIAYVCGNDLGNLGVPTSIYVIRTDGTDRRRVPTGTFASYSPSWSADGTRIAFATEPGLFDGSAVYTVRLDGTGRLLVAPHASGPAWSPDGKTIAYVAPCGIRIVTPTGGRAMPPGAPACFRIGGFPGTPTWSPDGTRLAIAHNAGVTVVHLDGGGRHLVTTVTGIGAYGGGRPAWAPASALARLSARRHRAGM